MFIANCKKQMLHFMFRIPERKHPSRIEIPSGQQRDIAKEFNLSSTQIAAVVKQCERYGYKRVDEISRKIPNFSGILYSTKAVSSDNISAAHEIKVDAQELVSAQESAKAVLGYEQTTRDKSTGKRLAKEVEVEVVELDDPRGKKKDKKIQSKITVSESGTRNKKELPLDV